VGGPGSRVEDQYTRKSLITRVQRSGQTEAGQCWAELDRASRGRIHSHEKVEGRGCIHSHELLKGALWLLDRSSRTGYAFGYGYLVCPYAACYRRALRHARWYPYPRGWAGRIHSHELLKGALWLLDRPPLQRQAWSRDRRSLPCSCSKDHDWLVADEEVGEAEYRPRKGTSRQALTRHAPRSRCPPLAPAPRIDT
jgi:hypothetical protein